MAFQIIEFPSIQAYEGWLAQMGDRVQIIHLATRRERWVLRDGAAYLDKTRTFALTYRERPEGKRRPEGRLCRSCGAVSASASKFCEMCGVPLFRPVPSDHRINLGR